MYNKGIFLIFCMIFVAGSVFSQNRDAKNLSERNLFYKNPSFLKIPAKKGVTVFGQQKKELTHFIISKPGLLSKPTAFSVISADHYTKNFGFFCKKELQFEKASKIPLRFRLGSLPYNDYLEQKPNAVNPF